MAISLTSNGIATMSNGTSGATSPSSTSNPATVGTFSNYPLNYNYAQKISYGVWLTTSTLTAVSGGDGNLTEYTAIIRLA